MLISFIFFAFILGIFIIFFDFLNNFYLILIFTIIEYKNS